MFPAVFLFQFSPILKVLQKFGKNPIKNQRFGSFGNHRRGARGDPPGPQAPSRRALGWGHARGPPGPLVAPPGCPLRPYILRDGKLPRREPFFVISPLFRRRRASKIGSTRRPLPGTLTEGGLTSGSFSTTMEASRMIRE